MAIPYSRYLMGNLPWYSTLIVIGAIVALWLASLEEKRLALPKDTFVDLSLWLIPMGILGARLYYVCMQWDQYANRLWAIFAIWEGGIAIYGAVIAGVIVVSIYAKRKKYAFFALADCLAPGLLLAQAIGRWGNYFNMEAYGTVIVDHAWQFFPFGVLIASGEGYTWHMATFFYESLWNFIGFMLLWCNRKKQKVVGNTSLWYVILYGSGRFIIEQLRTDSLYIGGVRASQWLSFVLCLVAIVLLLCKNQRNITQQKRFYLVLSIGALLCRWLFLSSPIGYALSVDIFVVGVVLLYRLRVSWWLLVPLVVESILIFLPSLLLRTILCSVTVPLYVYGLLQIPTGGASCPADT